MEQPYSPLNCFEHKTVALAGRSKIPKTNLTRIVNKPLVVVIDTPTVLRVLSLFIMGSRSIFMSGFVGPTYSPQSIMFSAHTLMAGGRFKISKYTGQRDIDEDLKRGTPSVDIDNAR